MILINLKITKIIVIRCIIYYFKGCKPARWLHWIGGAALLGEISATICVCRNPCIRFCGRWERRGSLLGVWASARQRLSAWAHLEKGGEIIKIFATVICSKQCVPRIWLGWRATSVTSRVSVGLCPCLKGSLSPDQNWLNARKTNNCLIRKFCSVKSHKTIKKVMHHQQHADLKSEIWKQWNSNQIFPKNPPYSSTMILAPAPSNSNLNSQKQKIRTVRRLYKKCYQHSDSQITASNPLNIQQCNQREYSIAYIIQRHFQSYPAKITASGRSVGQQAVETVAKMVCALIDPSHFRPGKFRFKKNENSLESKPNYRMDSKLRIQRTVQ